MTAEMKFESNEQKRGVTMFEKEADSYANGCLKQLDWKQFDQHDKVVMFSAFKDGAEFGYNKAKEESNGNFKKWHHMSKEKPKEIAKYLCCLQFSNSKIYSLLLWTGKEWLNHGIDEVLAWCKLPEFKEEK